jgi:hypothetical protein
LTTGPIKDKSSARPTRRKDANYCDWSVISANFKREKMREEEEEEMRW